MKYYQCSVCHELREDGDHACKLMCANGVIPVDCVMHKQGYIDPIYNSANMADHIILLEAEWSEISKDEFKECL